MNDRDLLESLIQIPSPTGHEAYAVAHMQAQARRDGLRVHEDRAGNFIAEAGQGDRLLLFVGHIDTVPGDIPVRIENGELWGRGSVDAKGPLAAAYCAARQFVHDERFRVMVVGAVDEEGRSAGVKALPADLDPEWIIVGEPSGSRGLTLAYKGILRGSFSLSQDQVHGAHAELGAADRVVQWWSSVTQDPRAGTGFDDLQFRLDGVQCQTDGMTDLATGAFQVRLPPTVEPDATADWLVSQGDAYGIEVRLHERMPAIEASRKSPLAAAFRAAIRPFGVPVMKRKTGTADMNHLGHWHAGIPILAYGPGDAALDHRPDERMNLEEFEEGVQVLGSVMETFAAQASRIAEVTANHG